jgi:hypothetical protein
MGTYTRGAIHLLPELYATGVQQMSVNTETAASYFDLAAKCAERGNVNEALRYSEKATELLLRPTVEVEAPGVVIGERLRFEHLGRVLAAKAERSMRG